MNNQKGNIFNLLLVLFVLAGFVALLFFIPSKDGYSVDPPRVYEYSVYLKADKGDQRILRERFAVLSEEDKNNKVSGFNRNLMYDNSFTNNAIVSLQKDGVYFYDKAGKSLQILQLPEEIKKLETEREEGVSVVVLSSEELNKNQHLLNFSHNQKEHYTYLYDIVLNKVVHLRYFDGQCTYIYCGGPSILKRLGEDKFVFMQGSGDACWNAGIVHKFDLKSQHIEKLFEYGNGCFDSFDSYIGMTDEGFIRGKRQMLRDEEVDFGQHNRIINVYLTNFDRQDRELISVGEMPNNVTDVSLSVNGNSLYLSNTIDDKYYRFDLQQRFLEEVSKSQTQSSSSQEYNFPLIEDNVEFLKFNIESVELGEIKQVYGDQNSLFVEDSFGVKMLVLDEDFLLRVKNSEDKQVCNNSFGEILEIKGHAFIFTVNSQCKKTDKLTGRLSNLVRKYEYNLEKGHVWVVD